LQYFSTFVSQIVGTILKNHTDDELLQIYRAKKSAEALTVLFNRYYHMVYGICMKYYKNTDNAKDSTMMIFEKLMDDIPKHEIQYFKAWLYRVSQNHCLMQLRNNKYKTVSFDLIIEQPMEYEESVHPSVAKEEMLTKMEFAMTELNDDQRKCLELFYLEKKTYVEIMQTTGFNFMQVKSFIQNGKRNLKNKLTSSVNE
jgi:RNA polymerase sigma factor (sigma-70 family)